MNDTKPTFQLTRRGCAIRAEIEDSQDTILFYDGDSDAPFAVLQLDPNGPGLFFNAYGFGEGMAYEDVHGRACVYVPDK